MPWVDGTIMSRRTEFCPFVVQPGANMSELCRRYGISRTVGYKWRERALLGDAISDRSRCPATSPAQTPGAMETKVLAVRAAHPDEGGRKLRWRWQEAGEVGVPAASTITAILRRHGQLDPAMAAAHRPVERFEAAQPNDWWQMDVKGPVRIGRQGCHPLMVIDDHSRLVLGVTACLDQQGPTVWAVLEAIFGQYGLPWAILCDNGAPWGSVQANGGLTTLAAALVRYGIRVIHGRPYRPQTQGKVERVNRTFGAAVLAGRPIPIWPVRKRRSIGGASTTTRRVRTKRWGW
jgi:transposase InsO family protein